MNDPLFACLFVISLSHWPEECVVQQPLPIAFAEVQSRPTMFAERWSSWSCKKEQTECRPTMGQGLMPSMARGK